MKFAGLAAVLGVIVVTDASPELCGAGLIMFVMIDSVGIGTLSHIDLTKAIFKILLWLLCVAVMVQPDIFNYFPDHIRVTLSSVFSTDSIVVLLLSLAVMVHFEVENSQQVRS